jgi:CheY-like chemotaxis protein
VTDTASEYSVLIIDDEEDLRSTISDYLQEQGIKVYEAKDGVDGIKMAENMLFNFVIVDLNMPKISGREVIEEFKKFPKIFKPKNIMVMSGEVDKDLLKSGTLGISV